MTKHFHYHHHHPAQVHHVAKDLEPLYHRISNLEHTLQEWHDLGHHPSAKELRKVQDSLQHVDAHYEQGQFKVNGNAPEGQAILANLLEKAHARLREFEVEAAE
jgi:hypothetical protein